MGCNYFLPLVKIVVFKFAILTIALAFPTVFVTLKLAHRVDMIAYAEPVACHLCYHHCGVEGDFTDLFDADMCVLSGKVSDEENHLTSSIKAWTNDGNAITPSLGCCVQ